MDPLQIEGHGDQFPFASHGMEFAQRELAETHHMINDPKHGFNGAFA
jgi:hypothetical protein